MPLRNRVTPFGTIEAVASKGLLMGNRGILHDAERTLVREFKPYRLWISCVLCMPGRAKRTPLMQPGRYTELFFLDEATALSAGHRPCFECRRPAARAFAEAMGRGLGLLATPKPPDMDRRLDAERIEAKQFRRGWRARLGDLPEGTMLCHPARHGAAALWRRGALRCWSHDGYGPPEVADAAADVVVLTPASAVATLRAGYAPLLHPSAD